MRRNLIILSLLIIPVLLSGQSQRLVLVEQFNNVGCDSCASANLYIDGMEAANPGKMTALKYHVSWPEQDPFNTPLVGDVEVRRGLYGVSGIPTAIIDGNQFNDDPTLNTISQTDIDNRYADVSPFDIQLSHSISPNLDSVYVEFIMEATVSVSGSLKAYTVIAEDTVVFSTAPGSNGETYFTHVAKQFLPTVNGTSLISSWSIGNRDTINYAWAITNIADLQHLEVIGFIQNTTTLEVHQTAVSPPLSLTPTYTTDAYVVMATNIDTVVCDSMVYPEIIIQNNGASSLTSLDINYNVNGGTDSIYSWTGNLGFLEQEVVGLTNGYRFNPLAANTLTITSSNPNGTTDDYTPNDQYSTGFIPATISNTHLQLIIQTDDYGQETAWKIVNSAGVAVAADTSYTYGDNQMYTVLIDLPVSDCYTLVMLDAFGDGICCASDSGYYDLRDNNGSVIVQGSTFSFEEHTPFYADLLLSTPDLLVSGTMEVYPNPFYDNLTLKFTGSAENEAIISLFDYTGRLAWTTNMNIVTGENRINLEIGGLDGGVYLLKVQNGNNIITARIISH